MIFGVVSPLSVLVGAALPALLVWLRWRARRRRLFELAAKVPGPPTLPVLGNALLFMAKPNEQLKLMKDMTAKYGDYVKFWLGPNLNIVVRNPKDIKLLLTSNKVNQKGPVYDHLKPLIGPGILTGGGVWRDYRKIVTPSYNKKSVAAFGRVFNTEAAALAEQLCRKEPGATYNVYFDVVNATTQCVCQTLMGLSKDDSQNLQHLNEWVMNTSRIYDFCFAKMTKWWLQIPFIFWLLGAKKEEEYFQSLGDSLSEEIVVKRRKTLERNEESEKEGQAAVDRLILSGKLSEQEIKLETMTLFTTSDDDCREISFVLNKKLKKKEKDVSVSLKYEGEPSININCIRMSQEASAKIASAVFLFLAHLPEWQTKVYNEIQERLGTEDDVITEDQIKSLHYLDMVFKEALRYMSIGALLQRTVEEEIKINSGEIVLPVGTSLVIPIHILHRDPRFWSEPDEVRPERFQPENEKLRDPCTFVPFSLGHMDCLGRVYAEQMIKTLVIRVLRHVRVEADGRLEDLDIDVAISVSFTKGYNLRSYPRRPNTARHIA